MKTFKLVDEKIKRNVASNLIDALNKSKEFMEGIDDYSYDGYEAYLMFCILGGLISQEINNEVLLDAINVIKEVNNIK